MSHEHLHKPPLEILSATQADMRPIVDLEEVVLLFVIKASGIITIQPLKSIRTISLRMHLTVCFPWGL